MIFGDSMGRAALASRLQNAAGFTEARKDEDTKECCKDTEVFAKCHPLNVKSGLILFIFKLNSCELNS